MTGISTNSELGWEIAQVLCSVRCGDGAIPAAWTGMFPTFAVSQDTTRPPDVVLDTHPVAGWLNPRPVKAGEPVWTSTATRDGQRLDGPDYAGLLQPHRGSLRGDLTADSDGPWSLAFALRFALHQAIAGQGLLLHASGVVRGPRLFLFAGHARAGKTTIARELNGGGEPFSVDRVVLRREESEARAYPTPFSDIDGEVARCEPAIPTAVMIVEQGVRPSLRRLTPASAACALVQHSLTTRGSLQEADQSLSLAGWFAERIPVYGMTFARDEGFWELLERAAEQPEVRYGGVHHDRFR